MNNEPVAWMDDFGNVFEMKNHFFHIPLYTHSADLTDEYCKAYWGKDNCFVDVFLPNSETEVIRFWNDQLNESYKPKTLTDEEIIEIWSGMETDTGEQNIDFARAILRKAQEK